ncbi:substrate-binding periplasmic protein [Rhizobium sp. C4]|uniref:substrate-binding periplasmic protein n=1 Tax=Rhizobium sp. C4 TaxID=1349800 RepID=UPI001E4787F2|nr:transporter substrate-binding domain-containing protein [Rhizobium sp. C4]MCD2173713.1 transporter substrate-binding domain-containing protein [Rhizobium sp. C4]
MISARALTGLALAFTLAAGTASATDIRFVTETYPPLNYIEDGQVKGASMDQIRLIMKNAELPYSVEIMPWARALALAEIEPEFCVFSAVHNAERDRNFKWVEPLMKSRTLLIRKQGSKIAPKSLEEAKAYTIGTQRGDFTHDILKRNNFPKIDLATDLDLGLKKLASGRIDLMPISEKYYEKLKRDGAPVESVLTLAESTYSIACNRNVPDATITRMQQELDKLIADGTQHQIFDVYGVSTEESAVK